MESGIKGSGQGKGGGREGGKGGEGRPMKARTPSSMPKSQTTTWRWRQAIPMPSEAPSNAMAWCDRPISAVRYALIGWIIA